MDGIPPALPTDSEDIAWALETAEALWRRGERVDAVVWVRRAAQAAGEGEDSKRAVALARYAAELGDWIGAHAIGSAPAPQAQSERAIEAVDDLLGEVSNGEGIEGGVLSLNDIEVVSAHDFEAGFAAPSPKPSGGPHAPSDSEIMTVSLASPDVELVDETDVEDFPEEEPTPVARLVRSPVPEAQVPSAAQAHAGMLDPWAEAEVARRSAARLSDLGSRGFDEGEVVTSAKREVAQPPRPEEASGPASPAVPRPPKAPRIPVPGESKPRPASAGAAPPADEPDTTTYRQINVRPARADRPEPAAPPPPKPPPKVPPPRPRGPAFDKPPPPAARAPEKPVAVPSPPPAPAPPSRRAVEKKPPSAPPKDPSVPPPLDLLEMVDSVSIPDEPAQASPTSPASLVSAPPDPLLASPLSVPPEEFSAEERPSATTTQRPPASDAPPAPERFPRLARPDVALPGDSARPTAPPPGAIPRAAIGSPLPEPPPEQPALDLGAVEALSDLPDDAREAFALAATMHPIATDEEVSGFALALVVEGEIDVSATIVDAPALRLERNAILRSRGTIVPGVALRLVCASPTALVASWNTAAVEAAFRTCPWVEEDLRAVTDRVQAKAGVTMGPLGDRFDQSLRDHLTSKLTIRSLSPGEVLIAQGKPTPIAIVGIGELVVTKNGKPSGNLGPGDFVFPSQTLAHAPAPATVAAGAAGAVVMYGDRAVAQELLMGFPPLLELLATM